MTLSTLDIRLITFFRGLKSTPLTIQTYNFGFYLFKKNYFNYSSDLILNLLL